MSSTILAATQSSSGGGLLLFLPLLLVGALFVFMQRSNRRRQQQTRQMQASLAPGVDVVTTAGMYAHVVAVEDDQVVLEPSPGVQMRFAKGAVSRVLTPAGAVPVDDRLDDASAVDRSLGERTPPGADTLPEPADRVVDQREP